MSTTVKPKVTTSEGGMDSWKKLERTSSQSMRHERVQEHDAGLKKANSAQDKILHELASKQASILGGTGKENPKMVEKPVDHARPDAAAKTKTEPQKVQDKDGAEKSKQQMQDNQNSAAKQYVDAQKAGQALNKLLQTMPKSVDAKLGEEGSIKTQQQTATQQTADPSKAAKAGQLNIPVEKSTKGEIADFKKAKPDVTKKGEEGDKKVAQPKAKGAEKADESDTAEGASKFIGGDQTAHVDVAKQGVVTPGAAKQGLEGNAEGGPFSKKGLKKDDKKTERSGGAGRAYRSNPTAEGVMSSLDSIYAGVSGGGGDTDAAADSTTTATGAPAQGDTTAVKGEADVAWQSPKATINPENPKYEQVYYAALENEQSVIKPRKVKLTAKEMQELYVEKPLTERIDVKMEIADTAEKIKEAKGLMQLLVMQMSNRRSPGGEGISA